MSLKKKKRKKRPHVLPCPVWTGWHCTSLSWTLYYFTYTLWVYILLITAVNLPISSAHLIQNNYLFFMSYWILTHPSDLTFSVLELDEKQTINSVTCKGMSVSHLVSINMCRKMPPISPYKQLYLCQIALIKVTTCTLTKLCTQSTGVMGMVCTPCGAFAAPIWGCLPTA